MTKRVTALGPLHQTIWLFPYYRASWVSLDPGNQPLLPTYDKFNWRPEPYFPGSLLPPSNQTAKGRRVNPRPILYPVALSSFNLSCSTGKKNCSGSHPPHLVRGRSKFCLFVESTPHLFVLSPFFPPRTFLHVSRSWHLPCALLSISSPIADCKVEQRLLAFHWSHSLVSTPHSRRPTPHIFTFFSCALPKTLPCLTSPQPQRSSSLSFSNSLRCVFCLAQHGPSHPLPQID